MKKIIQTRIDANGDVHLDFSGFIGRDCQVEEERLRRELAALGLDARGKTSTMKSINAEAIRRTNCGLKVE
jgi:hypothetical protein